MGVALCSILVHPHPVLMVELAPGPAKVVSTARAKTDSAETHVKMTSMNVQLPLEFQTVRHVVSPTASPVPVMGLDACNALKDTLSTQMALAVSPPCNPY